MATCVHDKELEKIVLDEVAKQFPEHKVANLYLFGKIILNLVVGLLFENISMLDK